MTRLDTIWSHKLFCLFTKMWIERIANPPPFLVLKVNNPDINGK